MPTSGARSSTEQSSATRSENPNVPPVTPPNLSVSPQPRAKTERAAVRRRSPSLRTPLPRSLYASTLPYLPQSPTRHPLRVARDHSLLPRERSPSRERRRQVRGTGALIPDSCDYLVAVVSLVVYEERYTPRVANGGWAGSLQDWWKQLATEPGSSLPKDCCGIFTLPYPLGGKCILLVSAACARPFQRFQDRLAHVYPEAVWDNDCDAIAPPAERACFSCAINIFAPNILQCDRDGRPRPKSISLMRELPALAARLRDDDSEVATIYAKAGDDIERALTHAAEAGDAAAKASTTPRPAPRHHWGALPSLTGVRLRSR